MKKFDIKINKTHLSVRKPNAKLFPTGALAQAEIVRVSAMLQRLLSDQSPFPERASLGTHDVC
jgi:hypothetical protein